VQEEIYEVVGRNYLGQRDPIPNRILFVNDERKRLKFLLLS